MSTKTCARCGATLPLAEFNRRADARDGRQSYCRSCAATALRERGPVPRRHVLDGREHR